MAGAGGFHVYDATEKKDLILPPGKVTPTGTSETRFESRTAEVALQAAFALEGDFISVRGDIENLRGDERGFILDYRIPMLSSCAVFSNDIDPRLPLAAAKEWEGTVFPLGAQCAGKVGVVMAIPLSDPRIFGVAGDSQGMVMRFYLGTSPKPKRFPNRASFVFLIYGIDLEDGFRSALSHYYAFFPDYYTPRLPRDGLFLFQIKDRVPPNLDQYGFDLVEEQWDRPVLDTAHARDQKHGIATFPYLIVGQREIKFLPALPKSYEEAMAIYDKWTVADHADHALAKENVASEGDIHLKEEVRFRLPFPNRHRVRSPSIFPPNALAFLESQKHDLTRPSPGRL